MEAHLSLSAATRERKMSTRWSKGTHCGASSSSAASEAGRPPAAASLHADNGHTLEISLGSGAGSASWGARSGMPPEPACGF